MSDRREELTVTREQVIAALEVSADWHDVAAQLDIPAGVAFMIATGIPADGSGVPELPSISPAAPTLTSPQSLVNARGHNPLTNDRVDAWVRLRAARELKQ